VVNYHCFVENQAGDDVVVSGILIRRWGRVARGARFDTEVVIRANHIRLHNSTVSTGVLTDGKPGVGWKDEPLALLVGSILIGWSRPSS
jgi:hypothetical protein